MIPAHREDPTVVFPSEVAAAFWRRETLRQTGRRSIRADQILSWDAFKERFFGRRQDLRPVNALKRTIFAVSFLEEHRGAPRLSTLVPTEYADESPRFLTNIRAVLPLLPSLEARAAAVGVADLEADARIVRHAYEEFLSRAGCFEPSWSSVGEMSIRGAHTIVYPELLEDFEEFAPALHAADEIAFSSPTSEADEADETASEVVLERYPDTRRELDALFGRLEALLDDGVPPSEIAITAPGLEEISELLEQEAARRQVPIVLRIGSALADYPAGRLFAALATCTRSKFALTGFGELLLDRGIPWKDRELGELLIRFGVDAGCLANGRRDAWESALAMKSNRLLNESVAARRRDVADYYRRLSRGIRSLVSASTFAEIKRRLYTFLRTFLDTTAWGTTNERTFQRCVELLDDLAEAAGEQAVPDPFGLYLRSLSETIYVERSEDGGINVYPYRVSAGICPRYHFIVNASRRATAVQIDPFPFLSDPLREKLDVVARDASDEFLRVYESSGRRVVVGYSALTPGGPELAPGRFVSSGRIREHEDMVEPREAPNLFRLETAWWAGTGRLDRVYPGQRSGSGHAAKTAFRPKGRDLTVERLSDRVDLATAAQSDPESPGLLRISPTHLESFTACPFSYFFSRVMGLEESTWTAEVERPQDLGSFYHRVLEVFFSELRERSEPIRAEAVPDYQIRLREIIPAEAEGFAERSTALHPVALSARLDAMAEDLSAVIEREAKRFAGNIVATTEAWYDADLDGSVLLYGKIDRIDRNPATGGAVVLDYKKGRVPAQGSVTGRTSRDDPSEVTSFQIPFYLHLASESGVSVDEAGYESIEKRSYTAVYSAEGKAYFTAEQRDEILERLRTALRAMAQRVRSGDYRCPREDCDGCAFRGLCRRKYVIQPAGSSP